MTGRRYGRVWTIACCGLMAAAVGSAGALAAEPPAPQKTPAQVKAQVGQIAAADNKRDKVNQLRRSCPAPLLAEALAEALASDPKFAAGTPSRIPAYEGLGSVGNPSPEGSILISDKQVDQLLVGLKESDEQIRRICAGALGRVPDNRRASVAEPLSAALDDASFAVAQQSLMSLARLKLRKEAPEGVRAIAFAPTDAMRAKWKAASQPVFGASEGGQELGIREMAMNVVIAWQGTKALLDQDLSKDDAGRAARAVTIGRRILKDGGRSDLDEGQHTQVIAELVELLVAPGDARDADRGAVMALATLAKKGASDAVKAMATAAIKKAEESAPASKQGVIRDGVAAMK